MRRPHEKAGPLHAVLRVRMRAEFPIELIVRTLMEQVAVIIRKDSAPVFFVFCGMVPGRSIS